ncbi:MAG: hypothetical protein C0404_06730 [Verrucomicrobia bacterium]|nr:hypothetical protein [Verrucomicrobiota bacterium]
MTSDRQTPGLPCALTDVINKLIDRMGTLNPSGASAVEPALVDPFCAVGDFINISSPPGCGKTLLAADVILGAVLPQRDGAALGGLFQFNRDLLGGGPVAIIDGENSFPRWNSIIRRKLEAEGADPKSADNVIKYISPAQFRLQNPREWTEASIRLAKALACIRVRFIIIDSLARMWAPDDINTTAWVQQGLVPFRAACQEYSISALLLSHTKRRQRTDDPAPTGPIGTSFQEGQIDGQIIMTRMRNGSGIKLIHQKSRRSYWIQQGSSVSLMFKTGLGYEPEAGWESAWPHQCPDFNSMPLENKLDTRTEIAQLLRATPSHEWSASEIKEKLDHPDRTIRDNLQKLERAGGVRKVGQGRNTRWMVTP